MNTGSSRFRTGSVSAPATPLERIRRALDDGERLQQVAIEEIQAMLPGPDAEAVLELLEAIREHHDGHRVYLLHRMAAELVIRASTQLPERGHAEEMAWARYYDLVPAMLVPLLREQPAEPELLNLVGVAYYELGHTAGARRLFEAIREIHPEHFQARRNLRACKERAKRGAGTPAVPEKLTARSRAFQTEVKQIAERATRLPEQTIALCMIVKDEEEMLPGCLEAVHEWVDEIVIVDTGSTDRTREIAAEFGARIVDFPWTGSFSEARNTSLEGVTSDWILYLDADEHLVEDDGRHLREYARRPWVEGVYLIETHYTGEFEMGTQTSHMPMRLFRRRPEYHWQGTIHEQLLHSFPTMVPERFANSPVRVNHYGYLKDVVADRAKRERNLELLLQQQDEPSAFTQFNIGSEYGAMNDWTLARPYFERAYELAQGEPAWQEHQFAPMMVARLVTARRATGDLEGALQLIELGLTWWPAFTDLQFERAAIHHSRGELDQARSDAERALAMGDAPARYVAVQGKGSYQARMLLAIVLRDMGDVAAAREQLDTALAEAPHFLTIVLELAEVMLTTDEPDEVAAHIEGRLGDRARAVSASLLLAAAFYEAGHLDHAERFYSRVLDQQSTHAAALVGMAELRLGQHRFDDAIELTQRVPASDPFATRAARTHFLAAVVAGKHDQLAAAVQTISSADYLPMGERTFYTAWMARLIGGHAVLPPDPDAVDQIAANLEALAKLEAVEEFERLTTLLEQALPDDRRRHLLLGSLYLRRRFADMAAEEYMYCAQTFGPDAETLTGLGKAATMKELWEDAQVFLEESLKLDPAQPEAQRLLDLIRERQTS